MLKEADKGFWGESQHKKSFPQKSGSPWVEIRESLMDIINFHDLMLLIYRKKRKKTNWGSPMVRITYIEFFFSSKHTPSDKYKCKKENVFRLLKIIKSKGAEIAAFDLADVDDPFRQYHKASSGPASEYRPVFGETRGSDYKDYFGKTIPALCCYAKKGDRAPVEVFPRMDKKLGRVYLIEEWLENYIGELERPKTEHPNTKRINAEEIIFNKHESPSKNRPIANSDQSNSGNTITNSSPLNTKQKRVTFAAMALVLVMFLCPPWYKQSQSQMYHEDKSWGLRGTDRAHAMGLPLFHESFDGYHWIFSAPSGRFDYEQENTDYSYNTYKGTSSGYRLAWGILFLQQIFVIIIGLVIVQRYRDNPAVIPKPFPTDDKLNPKFTAQNLKSEDETISCGSEGNKFFEQGMNYYRLGNYEECTNAFKEAVRLKPNFAEAWVLLGGAYGLIGKFHESIDASKEAIRLRPDLFQAYINLGGAYVNLGMNQEAIKASKKALSFKTDVEAYICLGTAYGKLGLYQESLDAARQAIRLRPNHADAQFILGTAFYGIGRHQEAIDAFKEAVRLNPDHFAAESGLSLALASIEVAESDSPNPEPLDPDSRLSSSTQDGEKFDDIKKGQFVDAISALLKMQKTVAGDRPFENSEGLPNRKAIGYIYGFIDAGLNAAGQDISDASLGVPITFEVLNRLFPGRGEDYTMFLIKHIGKDELVTLGAMIGGKQFIEFSKPGSKGLAMGLARFIEEGDNYSSVTIDQNLEGDERESNEDTAHAPDTKWKVLIDELRSLYSQRNYDRAVLVAKQAIDVAKKELDQYHVGVSLNELALVYMAFDRYAEAEPLFKRSMAIFEETDPGEALGRSLRNLANLYQFQGRYSQAEPLFKRSIAIREKALGSDHPDVATTLHDLAILYHTQGRYAEAEPLYKRSLSIYEKALGPDHLDVGHTLQNFANLYFTQRLYEEAEPLFKRSMAIIEKVLGPDHPDVGIRLESLALLYQAQGHYVLAEPLFKHSLAIREKAFGPDHPDVVTIRKNLAELYRKTGRVKEADLLEKR